MKRSVVVAIRCLLLIIATSIAPSVWAQSAGQLNLVGQFKAEKTFWKQLDIAKELVKAHDTRVLSELEPMLTDSDRHIRANVAFVFAALGDGRGLATLKAILGDLSDRPIAQGIATAKGTSQAQIESDRYYAVHVLGELKDPQAAPILMPLLADKRINHKVAWALGEIGNKSAIPSLIAITEDTDPSLRAIAVDALVQLKATEALPRIRALLLDNQRIRFDGLVPVSQAAKEAVALLEDPPWPLVIGTPVATRIITDPGDASASRGYYGECQVQYIAAGRAFLLWAPAYSFFDEDVVKQKMSSCPVHAFEVRYNPNDPADAVAMHHSR